jgi:hypothetical protein
VLILRDAIISSKYYSKVPYRHHWQKRENISTYTKNMKYPKETGIYYYILGKHCFNALQVVQLFHTNRCKIWPTVLVKGFCKLAAQLVSGNSKLHELFRKRSSYAILTVFSYFILNLNLT